MSLVGDKLVGVIGAGSMGGAVARGLVASGTLEASHLLVADPDAAKRAAFEALGARGFADEGALLAERPDVVVFAVKPQVLPGVLEAAAPYVDGRLVISIAAGITLCTIEGALPGARVVRAMPNMPVQTRSGASALAAGTRATAEDLELARELFSSIGAACVMREDQLDVESTVVGTAPAFFALFVDTLTRAGVAAGLPSDTCREMLLATMRGSADQMIEEGVHPRAYLERVTSPGGTTAAGLRALEPALFEGSFAAVDAAMARTRELAGK